MKTHSLATLRGQNFKCRLQGGEFEVQYKDIHLQQATASQFNLLCFSCSTEVVNSGAAQLRSTISDNVAEVSTLHKTHSSFFFPSITALPSILFFTPSPGLFCLFNPTSLYFPSYATVYMHIFLVFSDHRSKVTLARLLGVHLFWYS